jgi:hypothetical protein
MYMIVVAVLPFAMDAYAKMRGPIWHGYLGLSTVSFRHFTIYFNSKNYKANHAMSENKQHYDSIGIACVCA